MILLTMSVSREKKIQLDAGSIWFESEQGDILSLSPFKRGILKVVAQGGVLAKDIEKKFSGQDAFYFWVSRAIQEEFHSALSKDRASERHLYHYHKQIRQLGDHFERGERTVSHMLRRPHPALRGASYGERLFDCFIGDESIPPGACFLDVGAGAGFHAKDFLSRMKKKNPGLYNGLNYVSLDLAPGLLLAQRQENAGGGLNHNFVQADALTMPFADKSFDFVIVNEVIADFPVTKVTKKKAKDCRVITHYQLDIEDAPKKFLINSGAIKFIEELSRVLRPQGRAIIIEYGGDWGYPTQTVLKGHSEYSIHFGHLISAAKVLGFKVGYKNLFDFFRFSPRTRVITGNSLTLLQKLTRYLGQDLPFFAYTEEMLQEKLGRLYKKIHNLQFEAMGNLAVSFRLQEFNVLLLSK